MDTAAAALDPSSLPPELWHLICAELVTARDIARLAQSSQWLYHSAGLLAAIRDLSLLRVRGGGSVAAAQRLFAQLQLPHLRRVELDYAQPVLARLVGESLISLRSIQALHLVDVTVPLYLTALPQLTSLTSLRLERVGSLPLQMTNAASHRFPQLPPELAIDLSPLTNLRSLALVDVGIATEQCAFVSNLTALRELDLSCNPLRTRALLYLTGLTKLRRLNVEATLVQNAQRFWTPMGRRLEERGKYNRAVECYDNALQISSNDQEALWHKTLALSHLKRPADALECVNRLTELLPDSLAVRLERGRLLRQLKQYADSVEAFNAVLQLDINNLEAWWRKGASLIKIGAFRESIACFERAIDLRGASDRFMAAQHPLGMGNETIAYRKDLIEFLRGDAYYDLGDTMAAVACWHRALVFPGETRVGTVAGLSGEPRASIAAYERALMLNNDDESVWYTKGMILAALDRNDEALHCFERAFALDPTFFAALDRRGESLTRLGRLKEAVVLHERVCRELDPMRTRAWLNLATVLHMLDDSRGALTVIEDARRTVGDDERLMEMEQRCRDSLGMIKEQVAVSSHSGNDQSMLPEER